MEHLNWQRVQWIIDQALEEDIGAGDLTTPSVVVSDRHASAEIISKDTGVVAGIAIAERIFHTHDKNLHIESLLPDGDATSSGDVLMRISGSGRAILEAERTALNIIGRLSGIATKTCLFVEKVRGTNARILDTRKTAPLLRELDKYAVRVGGAENHRSGLYDMILIKENHIRYAGGIANALQNVQMNAHTANKKVEVEVQNLDEFREALRYKVDRIMLDNFSGQDLRQAVKLTAGRVALEASGGVTLDIVRTIAETGVKYISIGALTHSVKNFDVSLLFG
ncbi:MAG: carboxylating nicotinate-nucleotide diphosphorylase [bacterium]